MPSPGSHHTEEPLEARSQADVVNELIIQFRADQNITQARATRAFPATVLTLLLAVCTVAGCAVLLFMPRSLPDEHATMPIRCSPLTDGTYFQGDWNALADYREWRDSLSEIGKSLRPDVDEINLNCLHARDNQVALLTLVAAGGSALTLTSGYWMARTREARRRLQERDCVARIQELSAPLDRLAKR